MLALWIAARDPRTPWLAKATAGVVAAYALSPIDLIPAFILVLCYLDDLLIVPLGIAYAVRFIPQPLMLEYADGSWAFQPFTLAPEKRWLARSRSVVVRNACGFHIWPLSSPRRHSGERSCLSAVSTESDIISMHLRSMAGRSP